MGLDLSKYSSIVVYGLGKSGVSCLRFLLEQGYDNVFATDDNADSIISAKRSVEHGVADVDKVFITPGDVVNKIDTNSKIVFAPGIPLYFPNRHFILDVTEESQLVCDIELFNEIFVDDVSLKSNILNIGVTGTNGKSTICSFIDYILLNLSVKSSLVGNIGTSIFDIGDSVLADKGGEGRCLVTELSSFQLDLVKNTGFDVAAISNISDDHIQRHGNFENYLNSKLRIFNNSCKSDFLVVNYDDKLLNTVCDEVFLERFSSRLVRTSIAEILSDGVSIDGDCLHIKAFDFDLKYDISDISIRGRHNKENYAIVIALILCYFKKRNLLDLDLIDRIIDSSMSFSGVKHRMQFLGVKNGVKFVNDSKATNPSSVNFALDVYNDVFLIFGGYDKGADYDIMKENLSKVAKVYVIGESVDRIERFLKINDVKYEICFNLEVAFNKSFIDAKSFSYNNPVVMLSPGCASFDQWRNFEERGNYFCKLFDEIK